MKEIIVAPAIRKNNEVRISRFCHAELMDTEYFFKGAEQGFVTNFNRFVDRKEALEIAKLNNKNLNKLCESDELYSEDLFTQEHDLVYINKHLQDTLECMAKEISEEDENFLHKNIEDIIDYFKGQALVGRNYPLVSYEVMNEIKEVIVFKCRKCENLVCTDENNVHKIITLDCPHCGEESQDNWILHKRDYWQGEEKEDG